MEQVLFLLKTVLDLVAKYLQKNNIESEQLKDRPGWGYLKHFRKHNRLSFKNATLFYICDFHKKSEKIAPKNNLMPKQIWSCDKKELIFDPKYCKLVSG